MTVRLTYGSRVDREARLSAVAACVLDAMEDREIAAAVGVGRTTIQSDVSRLQTRYHARNRVALALKLAEEARHAA